MKRLPILAKVLRTAHELAHVFEDGGCSCVDLMPGPVQAMYRRRPERRDDGGEGGEVIQQSAFLSGSVSVLCDRIFVTYLGNGHEMLDHHNPFLHI